MENKYIINSDMAYEAYHDELFEGYVPVVPPIVKMSPWLDYIGPKMAWELWRQVLAFFTWSYDESKSETQVRLYFNKEIWRAWAFPQEYGTGMTTKELPELEGEERKKAGLGKGWIEGGTIHHHCSAAAFQSGVDRDNEKTKNGVHITVGNMDKTIHSLHGRLSFRGNFYDLEWTNWFEMPPGLDGLPSIFRNDVLKHFLTRSVDPKIVTFPSEWKDNLIKKKYGSVYSHPNHGNWRKDGNGMWGREPEGEGAGYGEGPFAKGDGRSPKMSKKAIKKLRRDEIIKKGNWSDNYAIAVAGCAHAAAFIATTFHISIEDLLLAAKFPAKAIRAEEALACEELETLLKETHIHFDDLDDWISVAWEQDMNKKGKNETDNTTKK